MTYEEVARLRAQAEAGNDPDLYEMAAAELEALGLLLAAQRCRDRAHYYRQGPPVAVEIPVKVTENAV